MGEGFEWISPLLNELIPQLLESTWGVQHSTRLFCVSSFSQQGYFSEAAGCGIFQGVTKLYSSYSGGGGGGSGGGGGGSSRRVSRDYDRGYERGYDRGYERDCDRYDDREYRSYR